MNESNVRLRELERSDLPTLYAQQADPMACALARVTQRERSEFDLHWQRILADSNILVRVIEEHDHVAGYLVCFGSWDPEAPPHPRQVGYWLGREFWGRGIATRALRLFLGEIEERPLVAFTSPGHRASQVVLEHCGFQRLPSSAATPWLSPEEAEDTAVYRLDAAEPGSE